MASLHRAERPFRTLDNAAPRITFSVKHMPGNHNSSTDSLSRLPTSDHGSLAFEPTVTSLPNCITTISPANSLFDAQRADPNLAKVIEMKLHGYPRPPAFV